MRDPGREPVRAQAAGSAASAVATPPPGGVRVGELGRAHGVRGEIRVKAYTQDPLALARLAPLTAADGRRIVLTDVRRAPGGAPEMLIARIEGVGDRSAAEALTRLALYAPREALGAADDPEEWLGEDLIGPETRAAARPSSGRLVAVPGFGAGGPPGVAPPGAPAPAPPPFPPP
ncbi:MAG: ribosome maturation factor RimM, partial [Salinarimonas sp.]